MRAIAGLTGLALLLMAGSVAADEGEPPGCDVPAFLLATDSKLPKVHDAIMTDRRLDIMVIGSRSATITAPDGTGFPGRMEVALREKLPGVAVNMNLQQQIKKTAEEVARDLDHLLEGKSPTLVVWQTGTVDAMRSVDPDDFRTAVEDGVGVLQKAGADVVLMNLQYSPRMETMISATPYVDVMRVAAQEREVPLFDRFAIMHQWNESGSFDLFSAVRGIEMARRVHDCLGRALAKFIIEAAEIKPAELGIRR